MVVSSESDGSEINSAPGEIKSARGEINSDGGGQQTTQADACHR